MLIGMFGKTVCSPTQLWRRWINIQQ